MSKFTIASICFVGLSLAACGSSSDDGTVATDQALNYVAPCTPSSCDELPVPELGCADNSDPVVTCAPDAAGKCAITVDCGSGNDDPVSYTQCDPSECGPIPEIGCAAEDTRVESCGSENGGACEWTIDCVPPPSTTPCAEPDGCGPVPEIAPICDDGSVGTLACMQPGDADQACAWFPQCPGADDSLQK